MNNPDFTRPAAVNTEDTTTDSPTPAEKPKPYRPENFQLDERTEQGNWQTNRAITRRLRAIAGAIDAFNLEAPEALQTAPVQTDVHARQRIMEETSADIPHLDNAAQAFLNGEDPEPHLIRHVAWAQTLAGLAERVHALAQANYLQAVNDNADMLTRQIGEKLFLPALAELTTLIEAHPGKTWNLEDAVNNQDFTHASIIKDNTHLAETLHKACKLRALLYTPEAFADEAAYMAEPGFKGAIATDSLQWWATVLDQGFTIWFPTANSWHKATHGEEFTQHRKAEAEAQAALNAEAEGELGTDKPEPYEPARYDSRSAY